MKRGWFCICILLCGLLLACGETTPPAAETTAVPNTPEPVSETVEEIVSAMTEAPETALPPEPEKTPEPTEAPTATPEPTPTPEPTLELITNERLDSGEFDSFYDNTLFVGDSLTLVFSHRVRDVRNSTDPNYLGKAKFLAATSMSAKRASENHTKGDVCFMYRGKRVTLPDGVHEIGPERVFMMFGLNDLAVRDWDEVLGYFAKIIDAILEKNPDVELIVEGVLPVRPAFYDKEPKWCDFNIGLEKLCGEKGVGYVSFAEELMDENGYLRAELAEGKAHLNIAGEDVWARFLRRYAAQCLLGNVTFETP